MAKKPEKLGKLLRISFERNVSVLLFVLLISLTIISLASANGLDEPSSSSSTFVINAGDVSATQRTVLLSFRNVNENVSYVSIYQDDGDGAGVFTNYEPSLNYTLVGEEGRKTVYVKLYNKLRDEISLMQDSIVLDTIRPSVPEINSPRHNVRLPQDRLLFSGLAEPGTEVYLLINNVGYKSQVDKTGYWGMKLPGNLAVEVDHEFCVLSKDLAGNISDRTCSYFSLIK